MGGMKKKGNPHKSKRKRNRIRKEEKKRDSWEKEHRPLRELTIDEIRKIKKN